jgi:hypothetical protein
MERPDGVGSQSGKHIEAERAARVDDRQPSRGMHGRDPLCHPGDRGVGDAQEQDAARGQLETGSPGDEACVQRAREAAA